MFESLEAMAAINVELSALRYLESLLDLVVEKAQQLLVGGWEAGGPVDLRGAHRFARVLGEGGDSDFDAVWNPPLHLMDGLCWQGLSRVGR